MATLQQSSKEIIESLQEATEKKTSGYDTTAEVIRIDDGTAWVHIPGGVDETPVKKTINASVGDIVQVRVSGGRAWITGNASAPPTDDTTAVHARVIAKAAEATAIGAEETAESVEGIALSAQSSANTASSAAASAVISAQNANNAATNAQNSANAANNILSDMQTAAAAANTTIYGIYQDAEDAKSNAASALSSATAAQTAAANAGEYAARALGNLSTVQSVAETLTWITQHGTMALTSDVALDPTHVYFVLDNPSGDYVVGANHYSVVIDPDPDDLSTYYELSIDESLNNYVGTHLALDSEGLWLLPASSGTNKVLIATGAGSTYTTAGTYIIDSGGTTVASFRANGATIGEVTNGNSRTEIGTNGMQIYQKVSGNDVNIANLGYGPGVDIGGGTNDAPFYTLGLRAIGGAVEAPGTDAGNYSTAEGYGNIAYGYGTHSEGHWTEAVNSCAHSEGSSTYAVGDSSHSEGSGTYARGASSHSEGVGTNAAGRRSHSEGYHTAAAGDDAHAQNYYTKASSDCQTALGKYNIEDNADTYAVIVGNGTADNARSNALTVAWTGNVVAAGSITDGTGNVLSSKADTSSLATVATSGSYNDLLDKPTIPTVNNATLTIQKNGTDVTTFTANASSNATANITVPTNTSDLNNDSRFVSTDSSGNVELSGTITAKNHSSAIGSTVGNYTGTYNLASGTTWVSVPTSGITRLSLTAGVWIVTAHAAFPSNNTGRRAMQLYNFTTSGSIGRSFVNQTATNGAATNMVTTAILEYTASNSIGLQLVQNSGSSQSVDLQLYAVRIA